MRPAVYVSIAVVSLLAGPSAQSAPDISGFWELSFDSRRVPAADLAQAVTPAVLAKQAERDAHAIRWCNFLGLPLSMDSPRPINIRQGRREIVINFETVATPRHLYFRPAHANMEIFDPTSTGDSIARWEGDTLVVDVTNFSDKTNYRGSRETLRLVERFRRVGNGLRYEVTANDPQTWSAPWTAALELEPQPDGMFEYACHEGNNSMRNILSGARANER